MKINQNITFLIALFFLGLFFSKAQSNDSLAFKLAHDSTDINTINTGYINNNSRWKQQVLSNDGGAILDLTLTNRNLSANFKTNGYNPYIPLEKAFDYSHTYKYSKIEYRPTLNDGQYISALHTQAYRDFSFGILYQKLISEGEFSRDFKDQISTEFRFNYHPVNKKYHSSFNLTYNVSKVIENGGFHNDSLFVNEIIINNIGVPTKLNAAKNEIKNKILSWTNTYNFVKNDSLKINLESNTIYLSKLEHYIDTDPTYITSEWNLGETSPYYSNFYLSTNETNDSIAFQSIKQVFKLNSNFKNFRLTPLIELEKNYYNLGFGEKDINLYKLGVNFQLFEGKLSGNYTFKNQNHIDTGMDFMAKFKVVENLTLNFDYQENAPDLFYRKYESNHFRWDNDFSRTKTISLNAEWLTLKKTTQVSLNYKNIDNHIYLNKEALPVQSQNNQIYAGAEINNFLKKGRFSMHSQVLVQRIGESNLNTESPIINLPTFVGRLKIAYKQKMFGDALVQPGIQINYNSKYYAPRYMAPTASFYLQNEQKIGGNILLDVFVNVKISTFTIYAMFNNILENSFLAENFTSPGYIGPIQQFNFGLRWNFYDN